MQRWQAAGAAGVVMAIVAGCARAAGGGMGGEARAEELAPGVVSHGHRFMVALEPDGRTLYTVERRFGAPGAPPRLVIQSSRRLAGGGWTAPDTVPFSGRWRDIDPALSADGRRLWFNSVRPAPGRDSARADFDLWYVDRVGDGWGEPVRLPAPVNTAASEFFATPTRDGTLYFTIAGAAPRSSWLARSRPLAGGGWTAPESLAVVNASGNASNPFVAPDESWLVFVAERSGGHGDSDLWVSHREGALWGEPRNLGPRVNTADAEFAPSVSPDGRTLYFTRLWRGGPELPVREERIFAIPVAALAAFGASRR